MGVRGVRLCMGVVALKILAKIINHPPLSSKRIYAAGLGGKLSTLPLVKGCPEFWSVRIVYLVEEVKF